MSNLLPRATARIHALTDGMQWNQTDWATVAAIAHAARQHELNEAEYTSAKHALLTCDGLGWQREADIAQAAVRASQAILECLIEGVEG